MKVPFSPPDITETEIELVAEAMRSGWITTGPKTKEFENEISRNCGATRTACLASATAAMELSLVIYIEPIIPVEDMCVPPHSSVDDPKRTTRTSSPYFSPKRAIAPISLA